MSRATVELDFFGMEREQISSKSQFQKFLQCQRSFRGIQSGISKINPEVLKSVIVSGSASPDNGGNRSGNDPMKSFSVPSSPKADQIFCPPLPVYVPTPNKKTSTENPDETTIPLTIFYSGSVSVFDVPRDKAEGILRIAWEGAESTNAKSSSIPPPPADQQQSRKDSLRRFLERRKERLTSVSPYGCPTKEGKTRF